MIQASTISVAFVQMFLKIWLTRLQSESQTAVRPVKTNPIPVMANQKSTPIKKLSNH